MSRSFRFGLALGAGLLLVSAGGLPAQVTDNNPDNTRVRNDVGGIPAVRRRRPRHRSGRCVCRHRHGCELTLLQPRSRGVDAASGRDCQYVQLCGRYQVQLGWHRLSLLRRLPQLRTADRNVRVRRSAGVHGGSAGRHGSGLFGQPDVRRSHLRPELLRSLLRGSDGQIHSRSVGRRERHCLRCGFRDHLSRTTEQPSHPACVRGRESGDQHDLFGRCSQRQHAARSGRPELRIESPPARAAQ